MTCLGFFFIGLGLGLLIAKIKVMRLTEENNKLKKLLKKSRDCLNHPCDKTSTKMLIVKIEGVLND